MLRGLGNGSFLYAIVKYLRYSSCSIFTSSNDVPSASFSPSSLSFSASEFTFKIDRALVHPHLSLSPHSPKYQGSMTDDPSALH